MFRFENEYILYGLFLLPVFVGLYIYSNWRQKKAFTAFGDFQLLKGLTPEVSRRMKPFKFIIICLIYTCLIFTLANPQLGVGIEKEKERELTLCFVSMFPIACWQKIMPLIGWNWQKER